MLGRTAEPALRCVCPIGLKRKGAPMLPEPDKRPVVLIVDDEPEILIALTDLLEDAYDVLSASSGEQGLALLKQRSDVAVIVSDQRMPGMTGDVFLARAR